MLEKAETLYQEVIPTGKNEQWLVNFLEEAKDHYEQVKAFYGYNCNMLNAMCNPMKSMKWVVILSNVFG